jgi:beta-lactam-binding protein with PASTA domain
VVPDFDNIHINDLENFVSSINLKYKIIDSVSYKLRKKGVVVNQDPLPFTKVKMHRKIYLTINSIKTSRVYFPDIFDLTLREAVVKLQKKGFKVGKLEYKSDIATNKVLAFKVNGIEVKVGQELYIGTVIDLIVGKGLSNKMVKIPNLIGLSRFEANIILKSKSLNVGLEYFNSNVSDSNSAVIYKQYPSSLNTKEINIGSSLDLFFSVP